MDLVLTNNYLFKGVGLGYGRQLYFHCLLKYMVISAFENPLQFQAWDLDTDGYINVEEFAFAGHAKIESPSTRELFKEIDSDSKHE